MVSITLECVTVRFGDVVAVDDVSFSVRDGELFSLLGPSGCGKTTTLRTIAGFVEADSGHVFFDDRCIDDLSPQARNVGFVFQNVALFPHLNVRDNIAFGLESRRWQERDIERRVTELVDLTRLQGLEKRYPRGLSGGQQQRVALARALASKPTVLLLDEPLASLDANLKDSLKSEVKRIQRETGVTTIYVTHDQNEAFSVSETIAIMNEGKVLQKGTPFQIYGRPDSDFVARFLGVSNFYRGRVTKVTKRGSIIELDGKEVLAGTLPKKQGDPLTFFIRPENVHISLEEASAEHNVFKGTLRFVSFQGFYVRAKVDTDIGPFDIVSLTGSIDTEKLEERLGRPVYLHFDPDDVAVASF
jgi:ABC-type Fe3+/spermidine/putrescine transport system ATPase subunit